jgi:hypothetical protein
MMKNEDTADFEKECNSCRKVVFTTNKANWKWNQCKDCQDKFRFKVILHYISSLDKMINAFSPVVPRGDNMDRPIGFTVVGRVETSEEAEWLYKRVGMSLKPIQGRYQYDEAD